jgi:hypothetical protein
MSLVSEADSNLAITGNPKLAALCHFATDQRLRPPFSTATDIKAKSATWDKASFRGEGRAVADSSPTTLSSQGSQ